MLIFEARAPLLVFQARALRVGVGVLWLRHGVGVGGVELSFNSRRQTGNALS